MMLTECNDIFKTLRVGKGSLFSINHFHIDCVQMQSNLVFLLPHYPGIEVVTHLKIEDFVRSHTALNVNKEMVKFWVAIICRK